MTTTAGASGYRKYVVFITVSLAMFMSSVNATIVATALPSIQQGLAAPLNWTGWVITAYQLMNMTVMPLMGRISDEWGRRRIFLISIVIFTASSLCCALSPNIFWLIIFRFLQALGGGSFLPSAIGIVGDHFREKRAEAIGLYTSIVPLGGIAGPAIGGLLLSVYGWQVVFLVNLPIGALVFILAYLLLERDAEVARTRVDFPGAGLFAASILSLMYFLTRLGEAADSFANPLNYLCLALAVFFLAVFIRREKSIAAPILDLELLKTPAFVAVNAINIIYGACLFGLMSLIPYYAYVVYGMSNLASGTLLTFRALAMIGMSALSSIFISKTGYRWPMVVGFLVLAASSLTLSPYLHLPYDPESDTTYWSLAMLVFLSGIGAGMVAPASNNAAIELMPQKISAMSGLRGMFRFAGGILGTSVIVLVLSHFPDKAAGFHVVFLGVSAVLVLTAPFIRLVPDGRRTPPAGDCPAAKA